MNIEEGTSIAQSFADYLGKETADIRWMKLKKNGIGTYVIVLGVGDNFSRGNIPYSFGGLFISIVHGEHKVFPITVGSA
jgi:hypothetical protein